MPRDHNRAWACLTDKETANQRTKTELRCYFTDLACTHVSYAYGHHSELRCILLSCAALSYKIRCILLSKPASLTTSGTGLTLMLEYQCRIDTQMTTRKMPMLDVLIPGIPALSYSSRGLLVFFLIACLIRWKNFRNPRVPRQ